MEKIQTNIENIAETHSTILPVVMEFWASWCAPCRAMAPALDQVAQEFNDKVRLQKVNADEQPDLVKQLHVMAIPTMVIFIDGNEVQRRVGAQSPAALRELFSRLANGETHQANLASGGIDPVTRMLRLFSGLVLGLFGIWLGYWSLIILGGLIMFWGWYDRCPIWQAVAPRLKTIFKRTS